MWEKLLQILEEPLTRKNCLTVWIMQQLWQKSRRALNKIVGSYLYANFGTYVFFNLSYL